MEGSLTILDSVNPVMSRGALAHVAECYLDADVVNVV